MNENKSRTAVYFTNSDNTGINIPELARYALSIENVHYARLPGEWENTGPGITAKELQAEMIERVVIAGTWAGMWHSFFTGAMIVAQKEPVVMIAAFSEYGILDRNDTGRAEALIACNCYGIAYEDAIEAIDTGVVADTLVIGGGIAGIQAALEIANAKQKVFLVEKTGTLGGHMAMFDKTFPTLDCAACILTPKMVEVGQHPYIELMTCSEVREVKGIPGNYAVKILRKARKVNMGTCIGCGTCSEKCPVKVESEFDSGTGLRKAIYIPFPQAVPNKYLIDAANCRWIQENKCGVCAKVCPVADCINFDEQDIEEVINVGNIVVAIGFRTFDASRAVKFGYGQFPNVLTSLEFERLINAAGPTGGNIVLSTADKKGKRTFLEGSPAPESVALIHCIGSRDANYNSYCSKVCCMYSLKLAHLAKEKLPGAEVSEFYIDMRAYGKGYEEFYNRISGEGIRIIRGRAAQVSLKGEKLLLRSEDITNDRLIEQAFDMIILAVGVEPNESAAELASILGIRLDENGWFNERHSVSEPISTIKGGIYIAGLCQRKDIPDTVAQASSAAARVLQSIVRGRMSYPVYNNNIAEVEERARELSIL